MRTAGLMGFGNELQYYSTLLIDVPADTATFSGELILFVEEGHAPVKEQQSFMISSGRNGIGSFIYADQTGNMNDFNFDYASYGLSAEKLTDIRSLRLALPVYTVQYNSPQKVGVSVNGSNYEPQLAQDLNTVAISILKERFVKEMAIALARQLTKKLIEKGTEAATESIAKDKKDDKPKDEDDAEKEKQKKKGEEKAKQAGDVAGFLVNVVNTVTEKADTRNWQSLPAFVSYVRVPLKAGENLISVNYGRTHREIKVTGGQGIQMMGIVL
jgi:hypothetical protein